MRIALFCIMAEGTKHVHAQRSFRFLAKRHKMVANGTLAKRLLTANSTVLLLVCCCCVHELADKKV